MLKEGLNLEIISGTPPPKGKTKNVIGIMKDDLGGKIMKELIGLRAKNYS